MDERLDDFYRRFLGPIMGWICGRYLLDPNDADDLTQAVLISAYKKGIHLQDGQDPWPWLTRVIHNIVTDFLRQRSRRQRHIIPNSDELLSEASDHRISEQELVLPEQLCASGYKLSGQWRQILEAGHESFLQTGEFSTQFVCDRLNMKRNALYVALHRMRCWFADESGLSLYLREFELERVNLAITDDRVFGGIKLPTLNGSNIWSFLHSHFWTSLGLQHEIMSKRCPGLPWWRQSVRFHTALAFVASGLAVHRLEPGFISFETISTFREEGRKPRPEIAAEFERWLSEDGLI